MYLSTTRKPPVATHKWKLVYKQAINDNIVKHSCNRIKELCNMNYRHLKLDLPKLSMCIFGNEVFIYKKRKRYKIIYRCMCGYFF